MLEPHKCAKILGPPGTGKTTYLLNLIDQAAKKYHPERIGAVSLTNAAIEEMQGKVKKETKLSGEAAKNIRTIHSTCFRLLELKKEQVADKKIKEFNKAYPMWTMPLGVEIIEDDHYKKSENGLSSSTPEKNKKRFNEIQIFRHKRIPESKWPDKTLEKMHHDWKLWMFENNLIDFTGMLEKVLEQELAPEIDILLVDEAQDLSLLSMQILAMWSENTTSTVYVGDSDQAILQFAGAVPEAFINLTHSWQKTLRKTYRVSRQGYKYAMEMIQKAKNREDVIYEPTDVEGKVLKCSEPDLSLPGTHMILGRCGFHLNRWRTYLTKHGLTWHNPYRPGDKTWNPLNTKVWGAARTYIRIKSGEDVPGVKAKKMVKELISKDNLIRGSKKLLDELITEEEVGLFQLPTYGIFTDEFLSFRKPLHELFSLKGQSGEMLGKTSEEDVMKDPKVILGTCHSVKGGESDHVWIDTGTSSACLKACFGNPNAFYDECRVAYVAITRSRDTVGLLENNGVKGRVWE